MAVLESGPVVEPHAHGTLDVGDGQRIVWEESAVDACAACGTLRPQPRWSSWTIR
jgi:hypothetical protein